MNWHFLIGALLCFVAGFFSDGDIPGTNIRIPPIIPVIIAGFGGVFIGNS